MPAPFDGKSILVVDDDPDILNAIKAALEETGAIVSTAVDGDDITAAESKHPDLVVLDAMLPKRSGFLVMDRLKSAPSGPKPRVIMITGNAGKRHQAWAESRGVDGYLSKPFRMERLLESAERLLGQ